MGKLGQYNTAKEQRQTAKRFASGVLSDLKSQPKPNLPKSEEGIHNRHPQITVHDENGKYNEKATKGRSRVGQMVRESSRGERHPQDAVDFHQGTLSEMKAMKKPNLPKSETDVVKSDKVDKKGNKLSPQRLKEIEDAQARVNQVAESNQKNTWRKEYDSGEDEKKNNQLKELFGKSETDVVKAEKLKSFLKKNLKK